MKEGLNNLTNDQLIELKDSYYTTCEGLACLRGALEDAGLAKELKTVNKMIELFNTVELGKHL